MIEVIVRVGIHVAHGVFVAGRLMIGLVLVEMLFLNDADDTFFDLLEAVDHIDGQCRGGSVAITINDGVVELVPHVLIDCASGIGVVAGRVRTVVGKVEREHTAKGSRFGEGRTDCCRTAIIARNTAGTAIGIRVEREQYKHVWIGPGLNRDRHNAAKAVRARHVDAITIVVGDHVAADDTWQCPNKNGRQIAIVVDNLRIVRVTIREGEWLKCRRR